jgi:phage portal protein BeeE
MAPRSPFKNFLSRSVVPKAGLGNLLVNQGAPKGPGPKVATRNVEWQSPGQPQILDQDAQFFGEDAYLNQVYVMRCVQTIAQTISGLQFRAGLDPDDPASYDPSAPLAQLLGPATPQAPGGPNPETASRAFWAWTICQYIVYGRFAWECQLQGKEIVSLWPLVSACISAVPSQGGTRWFDSYVYTTPMDGDITLSRDRCIYAWRPSLTDWRVPETVLSAAKLPIYIAKGLDRYMVKLLENDMVASTLVVTPPFEEPSARRAWQEQFLTSFSGVDNRGKTIFAEAEYDDDDTSGKPLVQVEKIAQTALDADLANLSKTAKDEICVALGVPLSLIGNAQERIYANAQSEYKNFWVLTVVNLLEDLQDKVNTILAPRLGSEVGWFDLSRVAALQPPPIFAPPMIGDAIQSGVASAAQIANMLGIPAADSTKDADTDTVEIGEESASTGASMGAAARSWKGTRVTAQQLMNAHTRWQTRALNTYNLNEPFMVSKWLEREHIDVRSIKTVAPAPAPALEMEAAVHVRNEEAVELLNAVSEAKAKAELRRLEQRKAHTAEFIRETTQFTQDVRAVAVTTRATSKVHGYLGKNYPESMLNWVESADWSGPKTIPLSQIDMDRRPGGRDQSKVTGIAKGIAAGDVGASAPIIVVKLRSADDGPYVVVDGYHRLLAHKRLDHTSIKAFVGELDDDEGPLNKEFHKKLHDSKQNRQAELEALYRHETMPGKDWHNSDGMSPHGTREQFIRHMIDKHGVTNVNAKMSRDFLDKMHAADHNQFGECGAHEKQDRNAWLPEYPVVTTPCDYCDHPSTVVHASTEGNLISTCAEHASLGHQDANQNRYGIPAEIRPMQAGQNFGEWYTQNEEALVGAVAGE